MSRTRKILVALAVTALATSVASPADAAKDTFKDKAGDVKNGFDIRSVHVKNNGPWVKVRTKHRNLKYGPRTPGGGVSVYIDIAKRRKGPEFRVSGPVGFDGDYSIVKVRHWKASDRPLRCALRFGVNYKRDVVRFAVKRRCMDRVYDHRVGKVRVAAAASQNRRHGKPKTDWAPKRHQCTERSHAAETPRVCARMQGGTPPQTCIRAQTLSRGAPPTPGNPWRWRSAPSGSPGR